jgi:hypothetical protein
MAGAAAQHVFNGNAASMHLRKPFNGVGHVCEHVAAH